MEPQAKVPGPRSTVHSSKIGPFEVQHGPEAALGGGSYGKVFAAYSRDGCFAAVKVYRTHDGEEQAAQEAECYHRLGKMLSMVEREWFPTMLEIDSRGQPWPWLALAFAGQSLADHLHAHGPLPADTCDRFALQLQRALHVLHCQAKLLYLDLKPGNILWCQELEKLKVCDFGFSEPWEINGPQSKVQGPRFIVPNPRFCTYVTGLYRAPELWNLDPQPSLQALQKCLTTSVDLWSFGCVVYEAACARQLMKPQDKRQPTSRQTVATWCQSWQDFSKPSCSSQLRVPHAVRYWSARLAAVSRVKPIVLAACHPHAKERKWIGMK